MDPSNTPLGKMLLDEITPVVMVLRTPLVEEACSKNGLSFVQMLTPFCSFDNIDVPVRTASDQPYRLQKFKLRFFYASDIRQRDLQVSKERLKEVVTCAGDYDLSNEESDLTQINGLLSKSDSEILPSWFKLFNEELIRVPSFSEHEAFDHPVACLVVVSSKDENPINKFVDLFNTGQLPGLFNDGAMDPKVLKLYLLLHDKQDGAPENAMKILGEMKSTFGANASQLLCINSSDDGLVEKSGHPWESFRNDASPTQHLGSLLTEEDRSEIEDLAHNLASKHVIPYMEEKVRVLNQQVSATRKGFRNQIKNLWWRKGKEETPDASSGPTYTFSSAESQIRVLGDYAFMLRDYELALSNYRLISTDYKIDKAWRRYAGVQEMMGLTYFLLDQSRKEAEYCMENAFSTYLKIGSAGYPNATRCGLWWAEMLKTRDQFKEAAGVYFRIPSEEPLRSAVMLEQASYCYLFSVPPMMRKYGFHLVLSGSQYNNCDQIKHAIRTYRRAMSIFKGTTWSYIKDHVHFNVGQWYSFLGLYDVAVTHMLEILTCGYQSKKMQDLYLKNFLQIVQKTGKAFEMLKLPLPEVNQSSLRVIFEDHRTFASSAAVGVRESVWQSLEEEIIPSLPTVRTNWLELQSKFISRNHKESNLCVVGEAIKVDIKFKNPLQIAIPIFNVSLMCQLSVGPDEIESDSIELSGNEDVKLEAANAKTSDVSSFTLSEVDFTLEGGETAMVQLTVTPKIEGTLKIVGIKWKLSDSVVGYHNFPTITPKKTAEGKQKKKRSPTDSLKFVVIKCLPKLEGFLRSMPGKTYAGELQHLVLELNSNSETPVKNMKMKVSHPRYLCIGSQQSLNTDYPGCLEKKTKVGQHGIEDQQRKEPESVFVFPEDTVAQSGTSLLWPLWLHAAVPGNVALYIVLYYEIEDSESIIKYRTLRMLHHLEVLPSLDVSFQINPYPSTLQQFLVRMDVANKADAEGIHVHQLSSVGDCWEISLLQPVDMILPSPSLMPGQAFSCFLLLKKREKSGNNKGSTLIESDVKFSAVDSNELIYDISLSPLADFHSCERLHQEKLSQDDTSTVDFILISRPMRSRTIPGFSDRPCFSSHHICHSSVRSTSPISWQVDGPCNIHHDFSTSFCEVSLSMILYNCSEAAATVRVNTVDSVHNTGQSNVAKSVPSGDKAGWYNVSLDNDIKVISNISGNRIKSLSSDSVSAFIWSGSSTTKVHVAPLSTTTIPLQICVFSPGTYDLSNYSLHWSILQPDNQDSEEKRVSSGTCLGYPYYLTVLQCTSS